MLNLLGGRCQTLSIKAERHTKYYRNYILVLGDVLEIFSFIHFLHKMFFVFILNAVFFRSPCEGLAASQAAQTS
jgi:hypothetical protein